MRFKPKDAQYPQTYFLGAYAVRLGPDDEYETDDPGLIAAAKAHGDLELVKETAPPKPKPAEPVASPEQKQNAAPPKAPAVLAPKREASLPKRTRKG